MRRWPSCLHLLNGRPAFTQAPFADGVVGGPEGEQACLVQLGLEEASHLAAPLAVRDEAVSLQHLAHANQLAMRSAELLDDGSRSQRMLLPREQFQHVDALSSAGGAPMDAVCQEKAAPSCQSEAIAAWPFLSPMS
jgi:hypothetical protein